MEKNNFYQQYLGTFPTDSKFIKACDLWYKFYYFVEEYDRSVCTGMSYMGFEAVAIPRTREEHQKIGKFARKMTEKLDREILRCQIDKDTLKRAKSYVGQCKHEQIKEILKRKSLQ